MRVAPRCLAEFAAAACCIAQRVGISHQAPLNHEVGDGMQLPIVENLKIFSFQVVHYVALLVSDDNLQENSIDVGLNREGRRFSRVTRLLSGRVCTKEKRYTAQRERDSHLCA